MLLQNTDNKKEIEELLNQIEGTPITIAFKFESKEEYFSRTLGL
jgi:Txe/YoeB family toxin of Txe-Axe toxin-antitoxin module